MIYADLRKIKYLQSNKKAGITGLSENQCVINKIYYSIIIDVVAGFIREPAS